MGCLFFFCGLTLLFSSVVSKDIPDEGNSVVPQVSEGTPNNTYDVVIVGAGMSGLAAANLMNPFLKVLVLEGRDRPGGRSYSARLPNIGVDIEIGAGWVVKDHKVEALMRKAGVTLAPFDHSISIFSPSGERVDDSLVCDADHILISTIAHIKEQKRKESLKKDMMEAKWQSKQYRGKNKNPEGEELNSEEEEEEFAEENKVLISPVFNKLRNLDESVWVEFSSNDVIVAEEEEKELKKKYFRSLKKPLLAKVEEKKQMLSALHKSKKKIQEQLQLEMENELKKLREKERVKHREDFYFDYDYDTKTNNFRGQLSEKAQKRLDSIKTIESVLIPSLNQEFSSFISKSQNYSALLNQFNLKQFEIPTHGRLAATSAAADDPHLKTEPELVNLCETVHIEDVLKNRTDLNPSEVLVAKQIFNVHHALLHLLELEFKEYNFPIHHLSYDHWQPESAYKWNEVVCPPGHKAVFDLLTRDLKDLKYNSEVVRVVWNASYPDIEVRNLSLPHLPLLQVETRDGKVYNTKKVLVTVPNGVLKSEQIEFFPRLPDWKFHFIKKSGFGCANKVFLAFPFDFWSNHTLIVDSKSNQSQPADYISYKEGYKSGDFHVLFTNGAKVFKKPILFALINGKFCVDLESKTDVEIKDKFMAILRKIFGRFYSNSSSAQASSATAEAPKFGAGNNTGSESSSLIPEPLDYLITRWGTDKFARGGYTSFRKDSASYEHNIIGFPLCYGKKWKHMCGELHPENRLYFAGEGVSSNHGSTNGALTTGYREGLRILFDVDRSMKSYEGSQNWFVDFMVAKNSSEMMKGRD